MLLALKKVKGRYFAQCNTVFGYFCNCTDYLPNSKDRMKHIDLQIDMNMKTWQNPYNFVHEYSGWMNYHSSKAILECGCNK